MANLAHPDCRLEYDAVLRHWIHNEATRWTSLYNFLMGASILCLGGAALLAGDSPRLLRAIGLGVLSLAGAFVSGLWIALSKRSKSFALLYASRGIELERSLFGQSPVLGPFRSADQHRGTLTGPAGTASSECVLRAVPCLFLVVFVSFFGLAFGLAYFVP